MFEFLTQSFSSLISSLGGSSTLNEAKIDELLVGIKTALLEADVPFELTESFISDTKKELLSSVKAPSIKPAEYVAKVVHDRLKQFLSAGQQSLPFSVQLPSVIMVMGLQGSGKTTTIGKLASWLKKEAESKRKQRRILLGSVDFYRPAAIDQLELLAQQAGVSFYRSRATDPVEAAQELYNHFRNERFELLLLDTAGRMHIDNQLMSELQRIDHLIEPRYKFLVLDAMTGQESLAVARAFDQMVGFGYAIMTKMDSDTRGGAAFSFRYALKKPISFVGLGEKLDDFEPFHVDRMAGRILGMGDILTLAERAQEKIKQSEQDAALKAFNQGRFTLQDFANQMGMMDKIGSLSSIAKYLPALGGSAMTPDMLQQGERDLKKYRAIIMSMTPKERLNHTILDNSRKMRIAKGAGVSLEDIRNLLQRFEQSQQYVKLFKKFGRLNNFFK